MVDPQAIGAVAIAIASAVSGFLGGRLRYRKLAAEVTVDEVNAYRTRIAGLVALAEEQANAMIVLDRKVSDLQAEVHTLNTRILEQRREYEARINELHRIQGSEFERLARLHMAAAQGTGEEEE